MALPPTDSHLVIMAWWSDVQTSHWFLICQLWFEFKKCIVKEVGQIILNEILFLFLVDHNLINSSLKLSNAINNERFHDQQQRRFKKHNGIFITLNIYLLLQRILYKEWSKVSKSENVPLHKNYEHLTLSEVKKNKINDTVQTSEIIFINTNQWFAKSCHHKQISEWILQYI